MTSSKSDWESWRVSVLMDAKDLETAALLLQRSAGNPLGIMALGRAGLRAFDDATRAIAAFKAERVAFIGQQAASLREYVVIARWLGEPRREHLLEGVALRHRTIQYKYLSGRALKAEERALAKRNLLRPWRHQLEAEAAQTVRLDRIVQGARFYAKTRMET